MKRLLFGLLAVCGILLGTAALLPSARESEAVETMAEPAAAAAPGPGYVLGEYQGRVAVYGAGEPDTPREVTAIRVHYLPSADRNALKDGLYLSHTACILAMALGVAPIPKPQKPADSTAAS